MAGLATTAWAATPQVEMCKDTQFEGGCTALFATIGQCFHVPANYNHAVSSLRPNKDAGACYFFKEYNCAGSSFVAAYPGADQLTAQHPEFYDNVISFKCVSCGP
ncbi:hypothetical protein TGAMA5MH_06886 [Trichoderma gamsii]|uniref:Uncharacterized protein n=1 Tax=Trichoderma gamsii TaxID=398673 RepID=A0A2K0T669_9HYPO|nr:hypothetical protein TGAMA5MH_06886 [Trichoderma gamsii]